MKYVIEIDDEPFVRQTEFGELRLYRAEGYKAPVFTESDMEILEPLNSDYINEHYGSLQDEAYQRGLQDGKDYYDQGCEGCKYEANWDPNAGICAMCSNSYKNRYERKDADDEIKVGDEVIYNNQKFIVFATETEEQYASLFDVNGRHASASQRECQKTGRHFEIDRILEEMKT